MECGLLHTGAVTVRTTYSRRSVQNIYSSSSSQNSRPGCLGCRMMALHRHAITSVLAQSYASTSSSYYSATGRWTHFSRALHASVEPTPKSKSRKETLEDAADMLREKKRAKLVEYKRRQDVSYRTLFLDWDGCKTLNCTCISACRRARHFLTISSVMSDQVRCSVNEAGMILVSHRMASLS